MATRRKAVQIVYETKFVTGMVYWSFSIGRNYPNTDRGYEYEATAADWNDNGGNLEDFIKSRVETELDAIAEDLDFHMLRKNLI